MKALRLGAWVVLALCAVFLLTTGGTYPGIASVEAHVIGQIIAIGVLGTWCVISIWKPAWRASTPLLLPIAFAAAAYLLSGLFSQRPRLSFEPLIAGLGWALAYPFLARLLADGWFRARVAVVMTAFVAVVAFGYIVQVLVEWWNWWGLIGRFAVPPLRPSFVALWLGSPNLIGTTLVLLAPLVVAITWTRSRGRGLAVVLALAAALAVFLSGSRGAYLGVGVGAMLAVLLAALQGGGLRSTVGPAVDRLRARPILALPVVGLAVVGLALTPSLLARFAQGGGTLRLDLWRSALTIFAEHPIFGAGPGTWVQLKVEANPAGVPNLILPHAHDMYVQAAAEVGVVGLLALAVLAFAVARRLWVGWRSTDRSLSLESGAVLVSLSAFAAQSIVDNLVNLPMMVVILVAIVAWVDGGVASVDDRTHAASVSNRPSRLVLPKRVAMPVLAPVVALVGFALVMPALVRIDRAMLLSRLGSDAALRGHWGSALSFYEQARQTDPGFTLYEAQAAGALARTGRLEEARNLLVGAVEVEPLAINVIGVAALEEQLGNREAALDRVLQARSLGHGEATVALNAGLIAERLGEEELARDAFADAIAWDPALAGVQMWFSPPRVIRKSDLLVEAGSRVSGLDAELILAYGGSPVEARLALEGFPPSAQRDVYIAACTWLAGDTQGAVAKLRGMLATSPSDWYAAAWLARIGRVSEDSSLADPYARWANTVQGDLAPAVIGQASLVPGSAASPMFSLPLNYPWAVFLRPIHAYPLVPQLTLIGVL